uniref:Uncharacterized protein n=1 Tax=Oryza sativa subsp. japonica TaxID=39947 RepID=Q69PK2_ORYSJ|nr:hypothetical protein [Oryza sativa Japonica Group]
MPGAPASALLPPPAPVLPSSLCRRRLRSSSPGSSLLRAAEGDDSATDPARRGLSLLRAAEVDDAASPLSPPAAAPPDLAWHWEERAEVDGATGSSLALEGEGGGGSRRPSDGGVVGAQRRRRRS